MLRPARPRLRLASGATENGEGVGPNPPLAGMSESQFIQAMEDYKSGKRVNAIMKTFATPLSAEDNANLAAYYASLPKR